MFCFVGYSVRLRATDMSTERHYETEALLKDQICVKENTISILEDLRSLSKEDLSSLVFIQII